MAVFNDFKLSFPTEEQDHIQALIDQCVNNENVKTFHHFAILTSTEIANIIGDLTPSSHAYYVELSEYIYNKAAEITSGTEEEKWAAYKNLFPQDYRAAIQNLIDILRNTPYDLTFSDYQAEDAPYVASRLDALTASSDFFVNFSVAMQGRAARMFDGWQALHNLYSGDEQKAIAELLEHFQVTLDIPVFEDFVALGATGIADELREIYADTLYIQDIAKTFRDKAVAYIDGYTSADVLEETFISSYRPDLQEGITQFIQTLKDISVITNFSDIKNISLTPGGLTYNTTQAATSMLPQVTDVTPASPAVGTAFVTEINGKDVVYYKATVATVANVTAGLTSAINAATSEWDVVSAVDATSKVTVTAAANNIPFTLANLTNNYFPYFQAIIANLADNHPLYFGLAQVLYNNAIAIPDPKVTRTYYGRLLQKDENGIEFPISGIKVQVFEFDEEDAPVEIGIVISDSYGYFSFNYTVANAFTPDKKLRIKVLDEAGTELKIDVEGKTNLFVDLNKGTFESEISEWELGENVVLELDAVGFGESYYKGEISILSSEVLTNGNFSAGASGWILAGPNWSVGYNGTHTYVGGGSSPLYRTIALSTGGIYRVKFKITGFSFGSGGSNVNLLNSSNKINITSNGDYSSDIEIVGSGTNFTIEALDTFTIDDISVKRITPSEALLFNGNTYIPVETNKEYIASAYVYLDTTMFSDPIDQVTSSGIYLKPITYNLDDLIETTVINDTNNLLYISDTQKSVYPIERNQWYKISTRFNSGVNTSLKVGIYLQGDLEGFNKQLHFFVDNIEVTKASAVLQDITVSAISPDTNKIFVEGLLPADISLITEQEADGSSDPQITNIFPENPKEGDIFIITLDNSGSVKYKAAEGDTVADVVDGLYSAVLAESSEYVIITAQAAGVSQAQISHITPVNVAIGHKYRINMEGKGSIEFIATEDTSSQYVVEGLVSAMNTASADVTITNSQAPTYILEQIDHITPADVKIGAKFVLELNGKDRIEFVATAATVANVTAGLTAAINAATSGEWTKVTATDETTYVAVTSDDKNTVFAIQQIGGGWAKVTATEDDAKVIITADVNNVPFTLTKVSNNWITVSPTDNGSYLTITGRLLYIEEDDDYEYLPFTITERVIHSENGSVDIDTMSTQIDFIIPADISSALLYKSINTLDDIVAFGGLKNNMDGQLEIEIIQAATVSLPQITHLIPSDIQVGDVFRILVNEATPVTYIVTEATVANVVSGLIAAINAASGTWNSITPSDGTDYIILTYNSNNVAFTITQEKIGESEEAAELDAYASLNSIVQQLGFTDEKTIAVVKAMIEYGYNSALDISKVTREDFITTLYRIVGDFNAAKLYKIAEARKNIIDQTVANFLAGKSSYVISKGQGGFSGPVGKLNTFVSERCSCSDCEAAVSPLAYLTDLINYVLLNLKKASYYQQGTTSSFTVNYLPVALQEIESRFYQDFVELPASCEDVKNKVCQVRICIEVLRRYIKVNHPSFVKQLELVDKNREYFLRTYKFLLQSVNTSYDEVRSIRTKKEKIELAQRLGFVFDETDDFLTQLFIEPKFGVKVWDDYKMLYNGLLQTLIDNLIDSLANNVTPVEDCVLTLVDFSALSSEQVKTRLLSLDSTDDFMVELATIIHGNALEVQTAANSLTFSSLIQKEQFLWASFRKQLETLFSSNFGSAFYQLEYFRRYYTLTGNTFDDLCNLSIPDTASYLVNIPADGEDDFWMYFSSGLLSKTNELYILEDLSERSLEHLFGLVDTTKDVFSDGAKFGDTNNYIDRWNIRGVQWNKNTDKNGYLYLKLITSPEDAIEIYRDVARTSDDKVAVANYDETSSKYVISEYNDSGLSGDFIANTIVNDYIAIYISVVPLVLSWRLNALRNSWAVSDQNEESAIVDPDIIGPVDFNFPYDADPEFPVKPIDFWTKRKELLDDILNNETTGLKAVVAANAGHNEWGSSSEFTSPAGITIKNDGVIYISDTGGNRIRTYNPATSTFANLITTGLSSPKGIHFYKDGNLLIVDSVNSAIKLYNGASFVWSFGSAGSGLGQFNSPTDIVSDDKGNLFISNTADNNIKRFTLPVDFGSYTQLSELDINTKQTADTETVQIDHITPLSTKIGDKFVLSINGANSITYTITSAILAKITEGLAQLINDAATGDWPDVSAVDAVTHVVVTAGSFNVPFVLANEIYSKDFASLKNITIDKNNNMLLADKDNNRMVVVNGDGELLTTYGNAHNLGKDLVVYLKLDEALATVSDLTITVLTPAAPSVNAVIKAKPVQVIKGATYRIEINSVWSEFTATESSILNVTAGLTTAINGESNGVAAVDMGSYIQITADAANTAIDTDTEVVDEVRDSAGLTTIHNGDAVGGVSFSSGGKIGGSATFDGIDGSIVIASDADLDNDDFSARTVEIWFNAADKGIPTHQIIYKNGNDTDGLNIYIKEGILYTGVYGAAGSKFLFTPAIRSGVWHHVVVVFDGSPASGEKIFSAYLDGKSFGSADPGSLNTLAATTNGLNLGGLVSGKINFHTGAITSVTSNYYFEGSLDNFRIWNRALSKEEISNLYNRFEDEDNVLFNPGCFAVDKSGGIYVADSGNHRIIKMDSLGTFVSKWGSYGIGNSKFKDISAIAVDNDGNVYVTDKANHNMQVFNSQGTFVYKIGKLDGSDPISGSGNAEFNTPSGIAIDSKGTIYVSDTVNNRIQFFDKAGSFINKWTQYDDSGLTDYNEPLGIVTDSEDNVIVIDSQSDKLIKISENGTEFYVKSASPWNFTDGTGLAIDSKDYVYMVDAGDTVKRLRFPKKFTTLVVPQGVELTQKEFDDPCGIDMDRSGNLVIADKTNNRVIKMTSDGVYINDIGKADNSTGTGNGEFDAPEGIAVDESGNIYVADTGNNRIQKFDSSCEYLTKWVNADFPSPPVAVTINAPNAIHVDANRKVCFTNTGVHKIVRYDALKGMGAALKSVLDITVSELMDISFREKEGENIREELDNIKMKFPEFRYLVRLISLSEKGVELLDEHWDDFYNILIQVYKAVQCYDQWKLEERDNNITLSQDNFKLINKTEEAAITLLPWRGDTKKRKAWKNKLNSRISAEESLVRAHNGMIENAEDANLIFMRDALIMASNFNGTTLDQKAQDATNKLLIDAKNNCCQRTTRVSQAFETLTGVMWSLRTGQLQDTYPFYSIGNLADFDEEWKWMGSYASWRAAQFVFMYPENLLLPSFKKDQTTAFKTLLDSLRDNSSSSSKDICCEAKNYYDYFEDICKIKFTCGKLANTAIFSGDDCCNKVVIYKDLFHMFGFGEKTKQIYWSTLDPAQVGSDNPQTVWTKLAGFDKESIEKIVGVTTYEVTKKRFLCLLVTISKDGATKLKGIRCNLDTAIWEEDFIDIDIPGDLSIKDVVLDNNYNESNEVKFIVHSNNIVSTFKLSDDKVSSAGIDFPNPVNARIKKIYGSVMGSLVRFVNHDDETSTVVIINPARIEALARYNFFNNAYNSLSSIEKLSSDSYVIKNQRDYWRVIADGERETISVPYRGNYLYGTYFSIADSDAFSTISNRKIENGLSNDNKDFEYLGELLIPVTGSQDYEAFVFWRNGLNSHYTSYSSSQLAQYGDGQLKGIFTPQENDIRDISGYNQGDDFFVVYQKTNGQIWHAKVTRDIVVDGVSSLSFSGQRQLSFSYGGPYQLREEQTPIDLLNLKTASRNAYFNNQSVPKSSRIYFEEALYYVPVTIALELQKRGEYEKALDWFRYVYDYSQTFRSNRSVYYGLFAEQSTSTLDNFENQTNALLSRKDGILTIVDNPSKTLLYPSDKVASYKRSFKTDADSIVYDLPANHTIDFRNPQLIMDVLDIQGPTQIRIIAKNKLKSQNQYPAGVFAEYTATTSSETSWQSLEFAWRRSYTQDSLRAFGYTNVNAIFENEVDQIVIQIDPENSTTKRGQIFYIDNIRSANAAVEFEKPKEWLKDPVNPHLIAANREFANTRFVVMSIAKCMIEFADSEYTQDTSESLPRARTLYQTALELLNSEGMGTVADSCNDMIEALQFDIEDEWKPVWEEIRRDLYKVEEFNDLDSLITDINATMALEDDIDVKLKTVRNLVNSAIDDPVYFRKVDDMLRSNGALSEDTYSLFMSDPELRNMISQAEDDISGDFFYSVKAITGIRPEVLLSDAPFPDDSLMAVLRTTTEQVATGIIPLENITGSLTDLETDFILNHTYTQGDLSYRQELTQYLLKDLKKALADVTTVNIKYTPSLNFNFCVPPNPIPAVLRFKAELNLFKIRNCRNIAGVVREVDPFAAPTDTTSGLPQIGSSGQLVLPGTTKIVPSIYRYPVLIEKAKQLASMAQQMEASLLSALEKSDAEQYGILKAKQDIALSKAGVKLQDLRVKQSQDGVDLAQLQKERADIQFNYYNDLIAEDLTSLEMAALAFQTIALLNANLSAVLQAAAIPEAIANKFIPGAGANVNETIARLNKYFSESAVINSQYVSTLAGYERRRQEWNFSKDLAAQDIRIGNQQVTLAEDQVRISGQERQIAQMQVDNGEATLDFLKNKFTNKELYDWMSGILQSTYAFFLRQATGMAKLAENQLAFERQENPQNIIKADYWQNASDNLGMSDNQNQPDRRGLTGSARLFRDLTQLDQYAFTTDKRKLELTKTISLSTMAPAEFQKFRETGEIIFDVPMEIFDRDFPGHYLRLIKRVRTSVIALIPPVQGIKATLTNAGISYVVVESTPGVFEKISIARPTEYVALTGSSNATGMFDLNPVQNEKLLPFENSGVEGRWGLSMPKAANQFDYSTIADVLITFEYTALSNFDYKNEVTGDLGTTFTADRLFSFKNQFADQWYDLNNPDLTDTPMKVSFTVFEGDFPVNISDLNIKELSMYFLKSDTLEDAFTIGRIDTMNLKSLYYTPKDGSKIPNEIVKPGEESITATTAIKGSINTLTNAIKTWVDFPGHKAFGTWDLELDTASTDLFKNGYITDILFVITYEGETPAWPK